MRTVFFLALVAAVGCESDSAVKVFNAAPEATITSHEDGATVKEATEVVFLAAGSDPDHALDELESSWHAPSWQRKQRRSNEAMVQRLC